MRLIDGHGRPVQLTKIAGDCDEDDCPAVLLTDRGTVAVQGDLLSGAEVPAGEAVVEIPLAVWTEAVRALR